MKKKKMLSRIVAFMVVCSLCFSSVMTAAAEEQITGTVDGVKLTLEESSVGEMTIIPRGAYLAGGDCGISNQGNGRLYASGSTSANYTVNYVGVTVHIERLVNGSWTSYYSWSNSATNTYYCSTSKTLKVETGYYYRVCATHTAGMYSPYDSGSSSTEGIWI
ncbi:MAG: DUF6147 family protein [Schaedlerella sp.]|nr:DUF6147 family protein [Lachnospiraceae bacterium]MDY4202209.1 DUF6147 family protein [Schaedlerella sp.]